MSSMWSWEQVIATVVVFAPWLLVLLIGAGLCVRHASDQRRRSVLIGIALLIYLVSYTGAILFSTMVYMRIEQVTGSHGIARIVSGLVTSLPTAVALALVLYAAFYGEPRPRDFADDAG